MAEATESAQSWSSSESGDEAESAATLSGSARRVGETEAIVRWVPRNLRFGEEPHRLSPRFTKEAPTSVSVNGLRRSGAGR